MAVQSWGLSGCVCDCDPACMMIEIYRVLFNMLVPLCILITVNLCASQLALFPLQLIQNTKVNLLLLAFKAMHGRAPVYILNLPHL